MLKKIYRPHIVYNAQKIYRPLIILKHVLTCMCTFPSSRMSDRISLTWSEFQKFVAASFANARSSSDFSDVTLVGEDYQLEAHRLVLSAGSRFFHDLFKRAKHDHPLVYLKGTYKVEIEAILSFLYNGERSEYFSGKSNTISGHF